MSDDTDRGDGAPDGADAPAGPSLKDLPPDLAVYALGQAVRGGDDGRVRLLVERLLDDEALVEGAGRHEVWRLEGGEEVMPGPDLAFASEAYAFGCWLGMGSPGGVELRSLVDLERRSEEAFSGAEADAASVSSARSAGLRVLPGGEHPEGMRHPDEVPEPGERWPRYASAGPPAGSSAQAAFAAWARMPYICTAKPPRKCSSQPV